MCKTGYFCEMCERIPDHSPEQKPANTGTHSKSIVCVHRATAAKDRFPAQYYSTQRGASKVGGATALTRAAAPRTR
jgi:hypothetical protein